MNSMDQYLDSLNDAYSTASEDANVPDGRYVAICKSAEVVENTKSPGFRLSWQFVITDGPQRGRIVFKSNALTEKSLTFVKQDLKKLGIILERLSQLPGRCDDLVGRIAELSINTKQGSQYADVYINKYIGMGNINDYVKPSASGAEDDRPTPTDDDLPFDDRSGNTANDDLEF